MLGSNPSADSVASTDRQGGCFGIPSHPFSCRELSIGRGAKRQILGVRGQSPCSLRRPQGSFRNRAPSDNACIGLEASLRGRVTAHHRFMLRLHLDQVDALDAAIARIDQEVDGNVQPFRVAIEMLSTIPGLSSLSAEVIVSEIGIDMSRFPSEDNLVSWAGLCPKNDESAGKRRSNRMKKRAPWLKTTLTQCAWPASRPSEATSMLTHCPPSP